jgi:hypothetical protein
LWTIDKNIQINTMYKHYTQQTEQTMWAQ